ncbi:Oxoglutarate iron-dependent oxygenase protein [Madurella fahalii]|uniref:Oxoglutarate iron-dependent oxygenase protein n=1 Tax=Madurella fahalii TaxID=1157608 RepID=A0ABQ0GH76_9PEZI
MLGASTSGYFSWTSLPAEIRLMILEAITQQKHPGWASCASVCKEWQLFIEKQNFCQLKLQVPCLDDFESVVGRSKRRKRLIQHIWLDVELPEYSCHLCKRIESISWSDRNSSIISNGIWKLFRILSTWESGPELERRDLTLELNAHSPSDSKHWFKNCYFTSDNKDNEDAASNCSSWHDTQHGWVDGQQITAPPCSAVLRLFGSIDLHFKEDLPRVDIATGFVVRRQLRRWLQPSSLLLLLKKLPGLERMIYEPWRLWERDWRVLNDQHFLQLVQNHLPQSLKRVSVFEDFSESLARIFPTGQLMPWQPQVEFSRVVDPRIAAAFAARSVELQQLSVAYMVNAEDFFGHAACNSSWTWHHLTSLALTSQLLRDTTQSRKGIDDLLYVAGITARRMPKLQAFVLWNGMKGEACAFIYHRDGGRASITWRGTWDMQLSPRVVKAWQYVATEHHLCGALQIGKQRVHSVIESHGDAIHCLGLPCPIVAPASLWQIRREGG